MSNIDLLKKHNFNFNKAYGQNFIFDTNLLENIVEKVKGTLHSLGISERNEEYVYIERFAAGGMSSGRVNGKLFWECFLPVILRRSKLYK